LLVPKAPCNKVIREYYDPTYAAHPGVKRTCELLALNFWCPGMRKSLEDYAKECNSCQRQKENRESMAPLGDFGSPVAPFEITSMDITESYPLSPRKNRYLLTFVDHFSKYAEIFPIQDQSELTCARVYASQIITRDGSGSKLITDQGSALYLHSSMKHVGYWRFKGPVRLAITPRVPAMKKVSIGLFTQLSRMM
jgi:hypothetical protein